MPDRVATLRLAVRWAATVALVVLTGCGEPPLAVDIPPRATGSHLADLAGVVDAAAVEERLRTLEDGTGVDVVALLYEAAGANCGEAFRAGAALVEAWDADVAVVAVARPGGFTVEDAGRERCIGLRPRTESLVPPGVREEIAEEVLPPLARARRWDEAVLVAAQRAAEAASGAGDGGGPP